MQALQSTRRRFRKASPAVHRALAAEPLLQIGRVSWPPVAHEGQHFSGKIVAVLASGQKLPDRADAATGGSREA